jgi:hypothetical protein
MKAVIGITLGVVSTIAPAGALANPQGPLSGGWSLELSNYEDSCGREPTVAERFRLVQEGTSLQAIVEIAGESNEVHTVYFHGELSSEMPPATVEMKATFTIEGFSTEEAMSIQIIDENTFTGRAAWTTTSTDETTVCVGSDNVSGAKKH